MDYFLYDKHFLHVSQVYVTTINDIMATLTWATLAKVKEEEKRQLGRNSGYL
jgi:hypothetical protein